MSVNKTAAIDQERGRTLNESVKTSTELTVLLNKWRTGDPELLGNIIPAVYDELHKVAANLMRRQNSGHTLQATALISEAFLRIGDVKSELDNRGHFIGIVAKLMRNVLIDHARAKQSQKRGGDVVKVSLEENDAATSGVSLDMLALEEVLTKLAEHSPRTVQIAELHYFCGMTHEETAEVLEISESTVVRELRMLKSVLASKLGDD